MKKLAMVIQRRYCTNAGVHALSLLLYVVPLVNSSHTFSCNLRLTKAW